MAADLTTRTERDALMAMIQQPAAVGFEPIGRVTLLVREVRAQVRQPAMVPVVH